MGRERNPRFSHGAHALCRRARTCSTSVRRCRRREGGTVPGLARVVDRGDVVIRIDPRSAGVASRRPSPRRRSMGGVEGAGGWTGPRAHERFASHRTNRSRQRFSPGRVRVSSRDPPRRDAVHRWSLTCCRPITSRPARRPHWAAVTTHTEKEKKDHTHDAAYR